MQAVDINGNIDPTPGQPHLDGRRGRPIPRRRSSPARTPPPPTRPRASASPPPSRAPRSSARSTAPRSPPARRRPSSAAWASATHELRSPRRTPTATSTRRPRSTAGRSSRPTPRRRETEIRTAPDARTNRTDASFAFAAEPGSRYECSLDGGAYTDCGSPIAYYDLLAGAHTFAVRATDASGNTDQTPADARLDRSTAPSRTPRSPGGRATRAAASFVSFAFAGSDDADARRAPTTSSAASTPGRGSPARARGPTRTCNAGPHTFSVRAIDEAGNVDSSPGVATAGPSTRARRRRPSTPARRPRRPAPSAQIAFSSEAGATLRVLARRRRLRALHLARRVHRPRRGRPHVRRPRDRRGRQHRREPGDARLDDRPAAGHDDRLRPGGPDGEHDRDVPLSARATPAPRSSARSTARAFSSCSSPAEFANLAPGAARAAGPRQGRRRQRRRDAGELRVDDPGAAGDDDRLGARTPRPRAPTATFTFSADQPGVDLPLRARRRRADGRAPRR